MRTLKRSEAPCCILGCGMWFIAGRGFGTLYEYRGENVPVQHKELGEFPKARYALFIGERVILED